MSVPSSRLRVSPTQSRVWATADYTTSLYVVELGIHLHADAREQRRERAERHGFDPREEKPDLTDHTEFTETQDPSTTQHRYDY
jgi:hypothetical protein